MKGKTKKIMAVICLILTMITALPIQAFATFITDINSNAEFGVIGGSLSTFGHELHYANYDGGTYMLFCTEFGIKSPTGRAYAYGDEFLAEFRANRPEFERMAEMIYFGYAMHHGLGIPGSYEAQRDACATQQYVWEVLGIGPGRDSWNGNYMSSGIYANWLAQTESYYNQYHSRVSFDGAMNTVSVGDTTTFSDSNGVLANFDSFNTTISGVNFAHDRGSNDLRVTATNESNIGVVSFNSREHGIYELLPNGAVYSSGTMSNYVHFAFTSGSVQNLMFSSYVDPTTFSLSVEVQSGKIQVQKYNNMGNPVANCNFDLFADEGCTQWIANSTSDANGQLLFDNLKPGTYWVRETTVPAGYLLDTNIKRVDVISGQIATVEFRNNEPRGTIGIVKKDSKTGSKAQGDATLKDAVYKVYAGEDIYNVAKSKKFYSKGDLVATRTTDEQGNCQDITELPIGKYIVKEDKAPIGYLIDQKEYEVNLSYKDQYTKVITGNAKSTDKVKEMKVHIFKSGIKINSGETPGLAGSTFTIKLNSSVQKAYAQGYTYEEVWGGIDEFGNEVQVDSKRVAEAQKIAPTYEEVTTDENGNAYTGLLPYGTYIVKETITPKDYESATDFTFTISEDESEIEDIAKKVKDIVVNNEQLETYIKLIKQDLKTGKKVSLNNATFQIIATKDIYDRATGKILYKKGEAVSQKIGSTTFNSFTTNAKNIVIPDKSYANDKEELGTIVTPLKLEVGSYEITEIKTPNGFLQLENPVAFKVDGIRNYDKDQDGDFIKEVIVKNEQPTGTLIVDKSVLLREDVDTSIVDVSDLSGIEFELTAKEDIIDYADGSVIYKKGQKVSRYKLDKNGDLKVTNLPMGIYQLQEVKTIDGLVLNNKKYEIKFTQQDLVTKVYEVKEDISNDTTIFEFSKTDITGDKELEGAKLTVLDEKGKIIDTWTSTNKTHKIEGLVAGKTYTLREEIAPDGFVKATDIKFSVKNTKEVQKVQMVDKIVEITKTDFVNSEEIEGAELEVVDENGNVVDNWTSTKEAHKVTGLEEGKTYKLIEKTAPYGYELTEEIEFTVSFDKETQKIEMKDMPILIETPNTGDNSNMKLWLAMFAMSAISMAGIGIYEYKKKKSIRK